MKALLSYSLEAKMPYIYNNNRNVYVNLVTERVFILYGCVRIVLYFITRKATTIRYLQAKCLCKCACVCTYALTIYVNVKQLFVAAEESRVYYFYKRAR